MPSAVLPSTWKRNIAPITRPLSAGTVIAGRYALLRQIGSGGMGEVWLAQHCNLRVEVALKFLMLDEATEPLLVRHARGLFRQEARLSAQLCALTPHVVRVHDAGVDASRYFLVMEHVPGRSLAEMIRSGPLTLDALVTILEPVAAALDVAHANGVVHRDVKPGNILLAESQAGTLDAKLGDFGVALVHGIGPADHRATCSSVGVAGTPEYMSPEQASGGDLDGRSDVWALGVVAYEALTGVSPFRGSSSASLPQTRPNASVAKASPLLHPLPEPIGDWLAIALAHDPNCRFASAGECVRALKACAQRLAVPEARTMSATAAESSHDETPVNPPYRVRGLPRYDHAPSDSGGVSPRLPRKRAGGRALFELVVVLFAAACGALLTKTAISHALGAPAGASLTTAEERANVESGPNRRPSRRAEATAAEGPARESSAPVSSAHIDSESTVKATPKLGGSSVPKSASTNGADSRFMPTGL